MGLTFAAPLALLGLATLPLIYLLLRVTPPRPREIAFPAVRLLRGLKREEETPSKTPWPLLLLRLAIATCLVLAMAGPVLSPTATSLAGASAPTLIALDDGWPAAPGWERRLAGVTSIVENAARSGAPVALLFMSEGAIEPSLEDASRALERLRSTRPKPFIPNRRAASERAKTFARAHSGARIIWIADGLEQGEAPVFASALHEAAKAGASVEIIADAHVPLALVSPANGAKALEVDVLRASATGPAQGLALALDAKGQTIARAPFDFGAETFGGEMRAGGSRSKSGPGPRASGSHLTKTTARFDLPVELRNDISLLRIEGERSAGATALLDAKARVRRVALISGASADEAQPLLSPLYYLDKALAPFAQVRRARPGEAEPVAVLLAEHPNILVLADAGVAQGDAYDALTHFVEQGGVLARFAGQRLANASDDLLPVRLRRAGRVLGGAMSWETPKTLAEFEASSPFFGLPASADVSVTRQVLAEPEPGLAAKSWARLSDGTPLVTAERRGKGVIVLFHVSADTTWSNLPISGLFVDMLKRISMLSGQAAVEGADSAVPADADQRLLAPLRTLDGFGVLGAPGAGAKAAPVNYAGRADADHPPGLYGAGDAFMAIQTVAPGDKLRMMDYAALGLKLGTLDAGAPIDFRPWLLALAFLALLFDILFVLRLSGKLRWRHAAAGLAALALLPAQAPSSRAETPAKGAVSQRDKDAALNTRLAYVVSGDARIDEITRAGLEGLSRALTARTSFSPAAPAAVDPSRDELAFYPMLYWPVAATAPQPSAKTVAKIAAYMKQGGTIVFDTRDALVSRAGDTPTPETAWLRELTKGLDIPELEIAPRDHVITKTFYLLDGFVGRYANGDTWVEALPPEPKDGAARPVRPADSVSAIVITSNDLAGAWARDQRGQPLFPLTPGGARQREMALRGGVNLAMYTLTGNYKSDQVHVRDLLERLGQ
jgi:hypothetical protein